MLRACVVGWVTVLIASAWAAGGQAGSGGSIKPGERVELRGREWHVESAEAGRVTLVQPAAPTQSMGAFVTPVSAEASDSQAAAGRLPSRLVDGSGWEENYPGSGRYVHGNNVYAAGGCMWNGTADGAWLRFDLGSVFRLSGFYVWNYNEAGDWTTRGVRSVEILTSLDGEAYSSVGVFELARASGLPDDPGEAVPFPEAVRARYVRWVIQSNYRGGEQVGLSEVRFADADHPAPVPTPPDYSPRYARPEHPRLTLGEPLDGAENIVFPEDAGVVDVTRPPYGAKGDGATDDTAAIQAALDDHPNMGAIIYLPNGTYLVSETLRWPHGKGNGDEEKRTVLWGQSREGAVLKLQDDCPGFEDRRRPRAVVWTGQAPAQRFGNELHNLTIDTGVGNPGACGLQFIANNQGGVYDVTIVSGDGHGVAGLDMGYTDEQGPCLIKRVRVVGFDTGVHLATSVASEVLEDISLEGQAVVGLRNDGQPCTIRNLRSWNSVPAVRAAAGFTVLVASELVGVGDADDVSAVISDSPIVLRDVRTSGYRLALESHLPGAEAELSGPDVAEFLSKPGLDLFGGQAEALRLPVRDTPQTPWDPVGEWASVAAFGARPDDDVDDADAIQAAIDSGATTVYLPRGDYCIGHTIVLRGALRRLVGCRAWLVPIDSLSAESSALFRLEDGLEATVFLEGLQTDFSSGPYVFMEHASSRALVMKQLMINFQGAQAYRNTGDGDLYIEDVVGRVFEFRGQNVWARQFNPEGDGTHILNDGGRLWILGLKTEGGGTLVKTTGGGETEVIGGLSYTVGPGKLAPMLVTEDSDLSASFCEVCFTDDPFEVVAREQRGDEVRELEHADPRWQSHFTLYRARPGSD